MKVAMACWFPRDPEHPQGGVEAVAVVLARALARRNWLEVHVITVDRQAVEPERQQWSGITIHRLPQGRGPLIRFACGGGGRMLRSYLRDLKPDVVHSHDTFGIMTRGLDLPRVFTVHGFIHQDTLYQNWKAARIRSALWKHVELMAWSEQPHIISISPYVRERLGGIARGTIHDIENPVGESCFEIAQREDPGRIFSAAVIHPRKNTFGLAQAVADLPGGMSATLRLAGPVTDRSYGCRIDALIRDRDLAGRIRLLGCLGAGAVRGELEQAAVFALVSREEGAPMGIAEAMAAGVPVLASNRCGMPYMVRDGETGLLVDEEDVGDISRNLERLLSDPVLRARMGRAARLFAEDRFHPDKVAERTIRVYQQAVA